MFWICFFFFYSHDGQYVICGSEDHFVYIWRTQHGFPSSRRDKNEFYESFSGKLKNSGLISIRNKMSGNHYKAGTEK